MVCLMDISGKIGSREEEMYGVVVDMVVREGWDLDNRTIH